MQINACTFTLNWARAHYFHSSLSPPSSSSPWDSRQFWFALITRSLTRRERGWRRRRGLAEFPCAATMPIIAAPFPVNENEGVKKSREVKALPPGIVAALATYWDLHFSFYIFLSLSLFLSSTNIFVSNDNISLRGPINLRCESPLRRGVRNE